MNSPTTFYKLKGEAIPFSKESIEYALTFSIGGFMRILIHWLNDNKQKSPEKVAEIMENFISIYNYPNSAER